MQLFTLALTPQAVIQLIAASSLFLRINIQVILIVEFFFRVFWSILSLYRRSFNVSIGLDEASCAGQEVPSGISPRAE